MQKLLLISLASFVVLGAVEGYLWFGYVAEARTHFKGSADEFEPALREALSWKASEEGVDESAYESERQKIMKVVRTCAHVTPSEVMAARKQHMDITFFDNGKYRECGAREIVSRGAANNGISILTIFIYSKNALLGDMVKEFQIEIDGGGAHPGLVIEGIFPVQQPA
jgi:hypothetical protein